MATYKIDRSRNISFIGKFKFNYEVAFGNFDIFSGRFGAKANFTTGSYVSFNYGSDLFIGQCAVVNRNIEDNRNNLPLNRNGDGGISAFYHNDLDVFDDINKTASIRFTYKLNADMFGGPTGGSVDDFFVLSTIPYNRFADEIAVVSGTIEGVMYYGTPTNEFVSIDEYYPSENYFIPAGNNCGDDEFWKLRKLDEKTIRQWPKYTTLNWFEAPDILAIA